jgi:ribosomal protein S18 acetylase RimI-like enzyme
LFKGIDTEKLAADLGAPDAEARLSRQLGVPIDFGTAVWRWSERAAELPEIGEWVAADDPRLPHWLRPFQGSVLVAFDERHAFVAGVGIKKHDERAQELSVGTDQNHRGRGYASMLVAHAARDIIARGGVPIYRHEAHNSASAHVAAAAGFPDRNWHSIVIQPELPNEHKVRR